jgi:HK97 family phage major capsid protein
MTKLQKLLQERAEKISAMRGILNRAETEKRDITENDLAEHKNLEDAVKRLDTAIAAEERTAALEADLERSAGVMSRPGERSDATIERPAKPGEFRNLGEWLTAAFRREIRPDIEMRDQTMGVGSQGGYLVPTQFRPELLAVNAAKSIVRPRAFVIPSGDAPEAELQMPALSQGANGLLGGVQVAWTGEGAAMGETSAALKQLKLQAKEVTAYTKLSNMLLRNAAAASSIITRLLGEAVRVSEDLAFLIGDGVGKPLGIRNLPGRIAVGRKAANKIYWDDVVNMEGSLNPDSQENCIWVASQSAHAQIKDLKDSSGNRIFVESNIVKGFPATLDGKPIIFTGRVPVLGSEADLMLVDFSYYLIKDGVGPFIAFSEHVGFVNNLTYVKIVRSVDGMGWVESPLTLEDASTQVSPFVVLK